MSPADFYVGNMSSTLSLTPNTLWSTKDCPHLEIRHWAWWITWGQCSYTTERILYFKWVFADSGLDWSLGLLSGEILLDMLTKSSLFHLLLHYIHGPVTRIIRTDDMNSTAWYFWSLGFASLLSVTKKLLQIILKSRSVLVTKVSSTWNNLRNSDTQKIK